MPEPDGGNTYYVPPQRIGFKDLSAEESRAYARVAALALGLLGIHDHSIERLVRHTNVTAKVIRVGAPPLALRMRTGPTVSARTELTWLAAVRAGTALRTVEPFREEPEQNIVLVPRPDGAPPIECSLFMWADGEPLAASLTPENYRTLGRMSAELHDFATTWSPPNGLEPLRWNRVMYYEGSRLAVAEPAFSSWISRRDAEVVKQVVAEADRELARLDALPNPIFLHGNLEMWNVLVDASGHLRLLDFEDVLLGQPIHDLVVALYYGTERSDYPMLSAAFQDGYCSKRDWPAPGHRTLDLLSAARATMLLNHALLTETEPASVITRLLPLIIRAA